MNEETLSIHQQIIEKLDQLIEAQSTFAADFVPLIAAAIVLIGVILTICAAARRQRKEQKADREGQWKELHREKLEEALRLLQAIKSWSIEILAISSQYTFSGVGNDEVKHGQFTNLLNSHTEGETKYEALLTILTVYFKTADVEVRLGVHFMAYSQFIITETRIPGKADTAEEASVFNKLRDTLHLACNELV